MHLAFSVAGRASTQPNDTLMSRSDPAIAFSARTRDRNLRSDRHGQQECGAYTGHFE
jgi:hypothetical protein